MKDKLKVVLSKIVTTILVLPTIIWIYSPIIASILIPMAYMLPLAFSSWSMFAFFGNPSWLAGYFRFPEFISLMIFEVLTFVLGLTLFIWGVITLVKVKKKKEGLATSGPYKYVRHPQHLGIILMAFVNALYIPWTTDRGIKIGDILSWSIFAIILFSVSEYEDWTLNKQFGKEYLLYRSKTGSFFPKLTKKQIDEKNIKEPNYKIRIPIAVFSYALFVTLLYLLVELLSLPSIRWTYWPVDYISPKYWPMVFLFLSLFLSLGFALVRRKYSSKKELDEQNIATKESI